VPILTPPQPPTPERRVINTNVSAKKKQKNCRTGAAVKNYVYLNSPPGKRDMDGMAAGNGWNTVSSVGSVLEDGDRRRSAEQYGPMDDRFDQSKFGTIEQWVQNRQLRKKEWLVGSAPNHGDRFQRKWKIDEDPSKRPKLRTDRGENGDSKNKNSESSVVAEQRKQPELVTAEEAKGVDWKRFHRIVSPRDDFGRRHYFYALPQIQIKDGKAQYWLTEEEAEEIDWKKFHRVRPYQGDYLYKIPIGKRQDSTKSILPSARRKQVESEHIRSLQLKNQI